MDKIRNKTAKIAVIGLGYVGLPLAVEIAKKGLNVIGIELDENKIKMIEKGENYIGDVNDQELVKIVSEKKLKATSDFSEIEKCEVILLCVPTPLDIYKQPDLSFVINATESVAKHIKKGTLVVLESTTYPTTTETVMLPILEKSGLKCEKDFFLAFSPERVDPGNEKFKTHNTAKVVGAIGEEASKMAKFFYENVLESEIHLVKSPKEAEMCKIMENTFRIVNIALANEMAIVAEKMDISIWDVIEAASTKPFGFMPFYPGPGVGGHCIPIDPFYLTYIARKYDYHTRLIELAGEINNDMPKYVVNRLMKELNKKGKCLKGTKVLLSGIAYKKNISDMRESPAFKVLEELEANYAEVEVYDPFVEAFEYKGKIRKTVDLTEELLKRYNVVIITTGHTKLVNYKMLLESADVILDTHNIYHKFGMKNKKVIPI